MSKADQVEAFRKKGYVLAQTIIKKLGVHHSTLYRWIKAGKITTTRVGRDHYVQLSTLIAYLGEESAKVLGLPELLEESASSQPTEE